MYFIPKKMLTLTRATYVIWGCYLPSAGYFYVLGITTPRKLTALLRLALKIKKEGAAIIGTFIMCRPPKSRLNIHFS